MESLTSKLTGILAGETSEDETSSQGVSYACADGGVPVTLVVSGGVGDRSHMVSQDGTTMLSALALQGDDSSAATEATQFFLEQLADGQTRLKTADGQTLEIDVDPMTMGLVHSSSGMPVLLQVSPDGTLLQRDDVQIALAASEAPDDETEAASDLHKSDDVTSSAQEDSEEPTLDGESLPFRMFLQVGKEMRHGGSALDNIARTSAGTTVAIVTPDGDESDADDPPAPVVRHVERLEDFMDVVTTYRCKFCRFSCAWRSGLMSHFRSCHVAPSQENSAALPATTPTRSGGVNTNTLPPEKMSEVPPVMTTAHSSAVPAAAPLLSPATDCPLNSSAVLPPMEISSILANCLGRAATIGNEALGLDGADVEGGQLGPAHERHIFICGQCSQGFGSLDSCKDHMIEAHGLKVDEDTGIEPRKAPSGRKRGRPRSTPLPANLDAGATSGSNVGAGAFVPKQEMGALAGTLVSVDGDLEDGADGLAKRKVRAPKSIEDDFLSSPTKKKRTKKENTTERLYRCGERSCGYRFQTEESLEYHVRCHAPAGTPGGRLYQCPECGEHRDHWRSLAMHLWRSHMLDLDLHRCNQCGYRTFSTFKLENHARIHSEERDFTCAQCGKGFKQLSQLRNHHVVHLDRKNTPHKRWYSQQTCDLCQRTFSDSKCLRKHHQAVHGKVKPYVCSFCGHMSARKAMLQLHLRQHTGEKPFACHQCDYRTGDHNSLRRHKMRHTGTKPYKCPHCPYACIQAISYKMHMKNKHPGLEGLFACSLCSFRSVSKENFTNHMSDHKRGILAASANVGSSTASVSLDGQSLQLPEGTLQQLEGILPGNMSAAQLIYSCLSALQQEGGPANLPPGVTTYSAGDGTQTITIQVPHSVASSFGETSSSSLLETPSEQDQFYLTVQQQEDGSMAYLSGEGLSQGDIEDDPGGLKISSIHTAGAR